MSFDIPDSKYSEILNWIISTLKSISFIEGVPIYESDIFITSATQLPAIAIQRAPLQEETDKSELCSGEDAVKSSVTITLHIQPTEKDTLDPILYYFEETIFKEFNKAYLRGNPPNNLKYFDFVASNITSLFQSDDDVLFSNFCIIRFDFGYSL